MIQTNIPIISPNQKDVLNLSLQPMETIKIAFVGLGERGQKAIKRWCNIDNVEITAICDSNKNIVNQTIDNFKAKKNFNPKTFYGKEGYKEMCLCNDINVVYICTNWQTHTNIAIEAMLTHKSVAIEVPAALTLEEIWNLINVAEKQQVHCTMLENTIYDHFEMAINEMTHKNVLGEIISVGGGYAHPMENRWTQWRLNYNKENRGDVYPTHGFAPACKLLDIHRKDFLDYIVSVDTNSFLGKEIYKKNTNKECHRFNNADQTNSIIRTKRGKTITLEHNVMSPRPYSRMFKVVAKNGYAQKEPINQIILNKEMANKHNCLFKGNDVPLTKEETKKLIELYNNNFSKEILYKAKLLDSRGGMSFLMDYRLAHCLHNGLPLDIDVYDLAEWCSIIELSKISIENGSCAVAFPDFTRAKMRNIENKVIK